MKILLVEDMEEKARQVEATLRDCSTCGNLQVIRTKSFIAAVRELEANTFDLLVLDLVLPIRDGEEAVENGGKNVLSEIVNGSTCRKPSHIVCLTAFEEITGILREEAEKNLVHVVLYNETDGKWRGALEAKSRYVQQRLEEAEAFPRTYNVDIAIVTSSPRVELAEVRRLPGAFVAEYHQSDAMYYYTASWTTLGNHKLSVVACAAPKMGMTTACVTACKVIERWRPRFLVMTGIAAGTKNDLDYGDILVAEAAYDYGSGKILDTESGERKFIPSPNPLDIDAELHAVLLSWERDQTRMNAIREAWHIQQPKNPRLILGILASGAAVVQSKQVVEDVMNNSRKVVGLEMEAYAIFQAAYLARTPRPKVLVAKSVSDFADKAKSDDWQQYAAFTSARFVYEFFTNAKELQLSK